MLLKTSRPGFAHRVYQTAAGLWVPLFDALVPKHRNVLAVLRGPAGRLLIPAANIVTDAGDTYYAQKIAGEAVTNDFTSLYYSTVAWDAGHPAKGSTSDDLASVVDGSEKAAAAGYPKTDDADADNTGGAADVVTWLFSYAKADGNDASIEGAAISVAGAATWGAAAGTSPVLTAFNFAAAFEKTANDTLKVFVNHTMNGV